MGILLLHQKNCLNSKIFTREAIRMQLQPFDDVFNERGGSLRGSARPELDQAWKGLLHGILLSSSTPAL